MTTIEDIEKHCTQCRSTRTISIEKIAEKHNLDEEITDSLFYRKNK